MTDDDFLRIVAAGERQGIEFKGPRPRRNRARFCEVVRAVLGMANRRDGGLVIVGVQNDGTPAGLSDEEAQSWANRDHVRAAIASYVDPYVELDLECKTLKRAGPLVSTSSISQKLFSMMNLSAIQSSPRRTSPMNFRRGSVDSLSLPSSAIG